MKANNSTRWSIGILIIKVTKNQQKSGVITMTPYELVFCQSPRVGINALPLSEGILESLRTEKQLQDVLCDIDPHYGMTCFGTKVRNVDNIEQLEEGIHEKMKEDSSSNVSLESSKNDDEKGQFDIHLYDRIQKTESLNMLMYNSTDNLYQSKNDSTALTNLEEGNDEINTRYREEIKDSTVMPKFGPLSKIMFIIHFFKVCLLILLHLNSILSLSSYNH